MTTEMMSSEESDSEDADIIVVKPLPWHSRRVTKFFYVLKSSQAHAKAKKNSHFDSPSSQPQPLSAGLPKWAFELQ